MTRQVEALIAGTYLAGTNTRRVKRALGALFDGAVGKDVVSRTWRKVRSDWEAWAKRDLAAEDIVRLILDGTVVRVRLDRKATNISLLVVLGVRRGGQKVLLAVKNMGGESEAAWRATLDDLIARGLSTPEFLITDGGSGLDRALTALWPDVPAQRCTVHKYRNLLAHAPDALHDEVTADYNDMIYADTANEVQTRRRAFLRKWRLRCPGVATSLEEAGERLFAFLRLPSCQWKSARTTNAIERLHEEFKRRIKTQTVLPSAETAAMLFWSLLASGQITMRKVNGWQSLSQKIAALCISCHFWIVHLGVLVAYHPGRPWLMGDRDGRSAGYRRATGQAGGACWISRPPRTAAGGSSCQPDAPGRDHASVRSRSAVTDHRPAAARTGFMVSSR